MFPLWALVGVIHADETTWFFSDRTWMKVFVSVHHDSQLGLFDAENSRAQQIRVQVLFLFFCDTLNTAFDMAFLYDPLINKFGECGRQPQSYDMLTGGPRWQGRVRRSV